MHEAKTRLSQLVELAENGERVVHRAGRRARRRDRAPRAGLAHSAAVGSGRAKRESHPDFDAPLPDVEELFAT